MMTVSTFDHMSLVNEMENLNNAGLKKQIERWPGKVIDIRDESGFSVLHHAVLGCVHGKVATLISLVKELQGATDEHIKQWCNSRTNGD